MSDSPRGSELTFDVDYDRTAGAQYNRDFKGRGRLVVRPDGPTYTFSGRPRGLLGPRPTERTFHPADIANVTGAGRAVTFTTSLGRTGRQKAPFVFFADDAATAQEIANLLPGTVETDFAESRGFYQQLAQLGDPSPWRSPTNIIIGLNVLMFVIMGALGAGWIEPASMEPYIRFAANNGAATTDGEWWRLAVSMFVHYGIMHLALNMWALYQAGHLTERLLGRAAYVLTYLGSGLISGFASLLWHGDQTWSAGASGAVFGVYGAILGFMLRQKHGLPRSVFQSMMKSTLVFAGYNIVYGFIHPAIDNAAHAGGLLGGIALGWLVALPLDAGVRARDSRRRLQLAGAALVVAIAAGVVFSPRYDYRVADELAWSKANRDFAPRESAQLDHLQQLLGRLSAAGGADAAATWIETDLIPFYEGWRRSIATLDLAPGKRTDRVRTALVHVFELRVTSLEHLVAGLRLDASAAVERFEGENQLVIDAISRLQAENPPPR